MMCILALSGTTASPTVLKTTLMIKYHHGDDITGYPLGKTVLAYIITFYHFAAAPDIEIIIDKPKY